MQKIIQKIHQSFCLLILFISLSPTTDEHKPSGAEQAVRQQVMASCS